MLTNPSNAQVRFNLQVQDNGLFSLNLTQGKYQTINIIGLSSYSIWPLFTHLFIGALGPKQKKEIIITFRTDEAKVIIATVGIKVQEGANEL